MDGWSRLGSFKEEEVLEGYVENGQNLDRQMGGGNSFWERNTEQMDPAIWRDKKETGQTGGSRETLEREGSPEPSAAV